MLLHDLPFRRSQVASLLQDLIRDSDLSQIVQIAAAPEGDNTLFIHSQKAPKIRGIARQTLTVALGIRIARLDAQAQCAEDRIRRLQFVSELLQFEQRVDTREQFLRIDGLDQKIVGAGFNTLQAVFLSAEPGDHDDRNQPRSGILLEFAAELVAGFAGHDYRSEEHTSE